MFYYCNVGFLIKVGGKIVYVCDKFVMNIGIIGYVDYGKIILIVVIIKILFEFNQVEVRSYEEIDLSLEEKKRGIIINLIFVIYEIENRKYGYIDCFGYKDYIKNMIIGNFKNFILLV